VILAGSGSIELHIPARTPPSAAQTPTGQNHCAEVLAQKDVLGKIDACIVALGRKFATLLLGSPSVSIAAAQSRKSRSSASRPVPN
jgi:hypothetical protein